MVRDLDLAAILSAIQVPAHFSQGTILLLERQLEPILRAAPHGVKLDCSKVSQVDSAALNWLLALQERLKAVACQLVIAAPSPLMRDALIATRLDNRLQIVSDSTAGDN